MVANDLGGKGNVLLLFLVLTFLTGMSILRYYTFHLNFFSLVFGCFFLIMFLWWISEGKPYLFQGPFSHFNGLGFFVFLAVFFPWASWLAADNRAKRLLHFTFLAIGIVIIAASGSRASWLALLCASSTFVLLKWMNRNRWGYHIYYLLIVIAVFVVTLLYANLPFHGYIYEAEEFVIQLTGKRLLSGRELIWPTLLDAIAAAPWTGYGPQAGAQALTGTNFSAHNLYLQVALQVGVPGLLSLVCLMWSIWRYLGQGCADPVVRLAASYLVGVIVHQTFELSITQNNLHVGILAWLIWAIGLSRT
jgi:O-antigen ligase